MSLTINPTGSEETIEFFLSKEKHPIAFQNKVDELINCGLTELDAEKFIETTPFVMEVYCAPMLGVFLVESEALESTDIYNPYNGEVISSAAFIES